MHTRILFTLLLVSLMAAGAVAQDEDTPPEPRQLYQICDWGLLTIEESTEQPPVFIEIDSPADYSAVDRTFTLSGTGAGLFEGNIIVEVSQQGGDVLVEDTTVLQAEELGAVGDWSYEVDLSDMLPEDEATQVFVRVYSESPEDGSTVAFDSLRLNANSDFGLRYVEITRPMFRAGVLNSPLLVEGMAGAAFENNIVIEVRDFETGDVLAETSATVETDEIAGSGPFSAELTFEAEPGDEIEVYAYQPPVADDEEVEVSDVEFAIVSPLAQTYERFLTIQRDDPIFGAEDVCAAAEAEFDNTNTQPLMINNVVGISTASMMPLVNVNIEAAGPSVCPLPLRTRTVREGDTFNIEIYFDATEPAACTRDLSPITQRISLGTLQTPDFSLTVNGEPVE